MTVIFSIPSTQYTPRTINRTANIPAAVKSLRFKLTRENWPEGEVGSISIVRPDGSDGPSASFLGGTSVQGPRGDPTWSGFDVSFEDGSDLPPGQYMFIVQILQTLRTAVTIERF